MSLEDVVETLLILPENLDELLLELGDPVSKWMFSGPDLLQKFLLFHLRPGKCFFIIWERYHLFRIESFLRGCLMRPSSPSPQGPQP